jgi:voltage-gated potassium channel
MNRLRIDELKLYPPRHDARLSPLWREWCFYRVVFHHFRFKLIILISVLLLGSFAFYRMGPQKDLTPFKSLYFTFSLILGQLPQDIPAAIELDILIILIPIIGLAVIIEGIVDLAVMIGDRRRSERSWCIMMASSLSDHIVLVGLGKLGYRVYRLLRKMGQAVVVIERNTTNQFLEELRRDGCPILIGDARQEAFLVDANLKDARSIVLASNDDLANLEIALDARKIKSDIRVVLRMFDQNMADKIRDGFNIRIAMSQSALSAPAFATAAVQPAIVNSFIVGDQLVVMQRWPILEGGPIASKTVGDVMSRFGVGVVEHRPAGQPPRLFPPPDSILSTGDELLVQGAFEKIDAMSR